MTNLRFLMLLLALSHAPTARAQGTLGAIVTELGSRAPISGVFVEALLGDTTGARIVAAGRSDSSGKVFLNVSRGAYYLRFRRIGYYPVSHNVSISPDSTVMLDIRLRRNPQMLDSVQVQATVGGVLFESRRRLTVGGTVFTGPQLKEKGFREFREVALSIAGIHVVNGQLRTRAARTSRCGAPLFLLDGVRLAVSEAQIRQVPFELIKAIEIYQNVASTPAEYAGLSTCGVIVVWTVRPPI